jgi:subfamily B ATP-binding cassette protein MsbA
VADSRRFAGSPARRLVGWLRPYRLSLGFGILATTVASVLDGITLLFLIPLLRHLFGTAGGLDTGATGLEQRLDDWLAPLLAGASPAMVTVRLVLLLWAALLAKNGLAYLAGRLSVRTQEGLVRDLRSALFAHLLELDLGWLERTRGGQMIARVMHDADQAKGAVSAGLASFLQNLVLIATTLLVLAQLSWRLTFITLAAAPLLLAGIRALLRSLKRHARARADEAGEMTATVAERLGAVKLIRTYAGERREVERFQAQADRYRRHVLRTQRFAALTSPVSELFGGFLLVVLIAAGASPGLLGGLSPEALLVFIVAALRIMAPLKAITQFPGLMAQALACVERVFEVLDLPAAEADAAVGGPARFEREIRFERVWFRYGVGPAEVGAEGPPGAGPGWVLQDVSFTIPKGAIVALVGSSGAGKTTLAELLPRLREPTAGRILLDGIPLADCSRRSVRALMGFVGQETVIFNDTVHANIAYGRPEAGAAEVEAAARAAHASGFISQLPAGYATRLGERGTRLSGGQRQRIAIARAILRDPPILILDEATSALDSESERLVQDALLRLMRDRTVLVIAHRLATVRHADQILVLGDGRIVERGTHHQLLAQDGPYRRLCEGQFGETAESRVLHRT